MKFSNDYTTQNYCAQLIKKLGIGFNSKIFTELLLENYVKLLGPQQTSLDNYDNMKNILNNLAMTCEEAPQSIFNKRELYVNLITLPFFTWQWAWNTRIRRHILTVLINVCEDGLKSYQPTCDSHRLIVLIAETKLKTKHRVIV